MQGAQQLGGVGGGGGAEDGLGEVTVCGVAAELHGRVERAAAGVGMDRFSLSSHLSRVSQRGCQGEGAQYSNRKPKVPVYRPVDNSVLRCG